MKLLRVHLARLIDLASRLLTPECPYCRQRLDDCPCGGQDWLP